MPDPNPFADLETATTQSSAASSPNPFADLENPAAVAAAAVPEQGGMTPWRAATANPVEDMQANIALKMNRDYGTPLPVNQQHNEPETLAQAKSALLDDPAGLGANVLQGATLHGAGYLSPEIERRAASYGGMHPTAAPLAQIAGGAVPSIVTGGAADLVAGAPLLAGKPLAQALVRYAPSTVLGGVQGAVNTPEGATTRQRLVNAVIGAGGGMGGQALSDMSGNVVNRLETGRMPTMKPVATPLLKGTAKTGATAALGGAGLLGMHHIMPWSEGALAALPFFHDVRHALFSGPKDLGTGLSNLWKNVHGTLSTPKGPARAGGRFAEKYAPPRTAIPAAIAAPYLSDKATHSKLARLIAEHLRSGDQP